MPIFYYLKLYALTVVVFFAIDIFWLGLVARHFYKAQIGHLLAETTNWGAAAMFYLIFIGGILFFALLPALESGNWQTALLRGAAFGFFTYATYDLTNWATLRDWPALVVAVDLAWGTVLCASVTSISFFFAHKYF